MKKKFYKFLLTIVILLITIASINIIIDPYFHYHKPLKFLSYPIEYQRYQNNGILKNFDYNAIITGTSMCENFMVSDMNKLFNVTAVKVPESGARFKEINDELLAAFDSNNDIKIVVRGLDYNMLITDKDSRRYEDSWYPDYLYDDNLINDVKYFLNKNTLCSSLSVIVYTLLGKETTSFDEYSNWMEGSEFGLENINYSRPEVQNEIIEYTDEDYKVESENIYENVIKIAKDNENTQFYYFFTPYSILYFDSAKRNGELNKLLQAEKVAIEMLIEYDNIHLFSFFDCPDIICNLNNYKDIIHYSEDINEYILECMKNGLHELNKDNYLQYCENEQLFFDNYDYDSIFK